MLGQTLVGQQNIKIISGKVSDGRAPMPNVEVVVLNQERVTYTDESGNYSIEAAVGDILEYRYTGMLSVEVGVEDVTRILNITLYPDVQELDEVLVLGSNRKSQNQLAVEFASNKSLIRTAYRILDTETAAGNVRLLAEENINEVGLCVLDVLRGQFGGVKVLGNCIDGGSVIIRGVGSLLQPRPAVFDVDGQIFKDAPLWILPDNIERLAILDGLSLTASYGSIGAGGVIVINTRGGNIYRDASGRIMDQARLQNNTYDGSALSASEQLMNQASYLQDYAKAASFSEAKGIFKKYALAYSNSYSFVLDSYNYFLSQWKEEEFARNILKEAWASFENNPVALKALAYIYQQFGEWALANDLYKEMFRLRPNYAQSYLDLANSYLEIEEPQKAASIYARYEYLTGNGLMASSEAFEPIITHELNNMLILKGSSLTIDSKKIKTDLDYFEGTRLVFEWTDSEAEFELQFVNPEKKEYTWKYSYIDNPDRIKDGKLVGYTCEEYLIDKSLLGNWKVNLKYLGNKSLTPSYLKATIYHNFGTPAQRKEVKVFKLHLKGVNTELFSVSNTALKATY